MAIYQSPQAAAATASLVGARGFGIPACVVGALPLPFAAALAINDVLEMVRAPAGSKIIDLAAHLPDLDTGAGALMIETGYGVDPDYFAVASNAGQAGGIIRAGATAAAAFSTLGPLLLTAEDTIDLKASVGPSTAAVTGTIYLTAWFLPPGSF